MPNLTIKKNLELSHVNAKLRLEIRRVNKPLAINNCEGKSNIYGWGKISQSTLYATLNIYYLGMGDLNANDELKN